MGLKPGQDMTSTLATWIYSREEWKRYQSWKRRRKGLVHYLWHWLFPSKSSVNEVTITASAIHLNKDFEPFHDDARQLKRVFIREVSNQNIIEISYQHRQSGLMNEIQLPIPKGKLREAISLQENLIELQGLEEQVRCS